VQLDHRQTGQRRQALEPARHGVRLVRRAVALAEDGACDAPPLALEDPENQ
jgi:hypothetical protein